MKFSKFIECLQEENISDDSEVIGILAIFDRNKKSNKIYDICKNYGYLRSGELKL